MFTHRHLVRQAAFLPLILFLAAGCSKKLMILQVPAFYDNSLQTIAVVPFRSPMDGGAAGGVIADKLAAVLQANGTYQVYNRSDLQALLNEQDLAAAMSSDPSAAAGGFRKMGKVQAILTGAVSDFARNSVKQLRQDPIYGYDSQGRQYVQGYTTYEHIYNSAIVSATAALIRVADGATVHATPVPARGSVSADGRSPKYSEIQCLTIATDQVVAQLLEQFAIVRKEIEIDPGKAFRTAKDFYDNKWDYTNAFKADAEKMFVVLALPICCDRNIFRLVIVREGQRETLAETKFAWSRQFPEAGKGFEFSPKAVAAQGGGPGSYVVKFYAGPEPVMEHKFRIVR